MENVLTQGKRIISFLEEKPYLPIVPLILLSLIIIVSSYFGIIQKNGLIVLGLITGVLLFILFVKYPKFWLYSVTAFTIVFFRASAEGVSALDVISGFIYQGTLFTWLFWQIGVKHTKIARNIADWCIIFFFVFLSFNSIIAVMNGVLFLNWFREYSMMALILYYFPIRHYFSDRKDLTGLLILFGFVLLITDFQQFYDYYHKAMMNIVYAYQLKSAPNINQVLFTSSTITCILFALYQKKFINQLLILILASLTAFALVSTFSRTFWIILLIELVVIFFYVPLTKKLRLSIYSVILIASFSIFVFYVFKGGYDIAIKVVENRLKSSELGLKDISVESRLQEYQSVLKKIEQFPLGGNGMTKQFSFLNPIKNETTITDIQHNGYLFLFYRMGIPLSIFYLFALLFFTFRSAILSWKIKDNFYKLVALGALSVLITVVISDFTCTQFASRDGTFVIALAYAFAGIAEKNFSENRT